MNPADKYHATRWARAPLMTMIMISAMTMIMTLAIMMIMVMIIINHDDYDDDYDDVRSLPWKLLLQILKVFLVTAQLWIFASVSPNAVW